MDVLTGRPGRLTECEKILYADKFILRTKFKGQRLKNDYAYA
jgi:hypothetical protein